MRHRAKQELLSGGKTIGFGIYPTSLFDSPRVLSPAEQMTYIYFLNDQAGVKYSMTDLAEEIGLDRNRTAKIVRKLVAYQYIEVESITTKKFKVTPLLAKPAVIDKHAALELDDSDYISDND